MGEGGGVHGGGVKTCMWVMCKSSQVVSLLFKEYNISVHKSQCPYNSRNVTNLGLL